MAENGGNVHDGAQAILRGVRADIAGMMRDIAQLKQRLGGAGNRLDGVESRLDGVEQVKRATLDLVESVTKSVTTMRLTVEAALGKILKARQPMGSRLNIIEGRLAAIEEHTGMVRV